MKETVDMVNGDFTASLRERLEEFDRRIKETENELNRLINLKTAAATLLEGETTKNTPKPEAITSRFARMNVPQALETIFRSNGNQPLHVKVLTDLLLEGGWKTDAVKPKLTVTGALVRDTTRFENVGQNTFRLKEKGGNEARS